MTVTGGIDLLIAWCTFGVLLLALVAVLLMRGPKPGSEPTSGAPRSGRPEPSKPKPDSGPHAHDDG